MGVVFWLIVTTVVLNGLLAGMSFDVATVKLPTRKRIGVIAYAWFARGNDLGNGIVIYPALGIAAALFALGTTLAAYLTHAATTVLLPLALSSGGTVIHSIATAKAAPVMLSLRNTADDENILAQKLDRFAAWHTFRATFQLLTFIVLVWALVQASR